MTDFAQQILAGAHGLRAIEEQVVDPLSDVLFEFARGVALREQTQLTSTFAAETLSCEGIPSCSALADGLHHEWADNGRCQANAHFRQAKLRIFGANCHVAGLCARLCAQHPGG